MPETAVQVTNAAAILKELTEVLGPSGVLTDPGDLDRYGRDQSGHPGEAAIAVLRPASTIEVSRAVTICARHGVAIVPQGGRTGLSGGGCGIVGSVILSLERLRGIEAVDAAGMTMTVRAGTPLEEVQNHARKVGLDYPVDLGARGTATIGGTIATNAGGIRVLRFGMTRQQVLGLEVVLPDGEVLTQMHGLVKDNSGYDLKQIFIGSEGTLGIICRAVLQLKPYRPNSALALIALRDHDAALQCLSSLRDRFDTALIAFEGMWPDYWQMVCHEAAIVKTPFEGTHGFYALLEIELRPDETSDALEAWLSDAFEADLIQDGVLAQSLSEHRNLWTIREAVGEIDDQLGPHINFDIAVAPSRLGRFCIEVQTLLATLPDALRSVKVGHVGDGNVHLLVSHASDRDPSLIERAVYDLVQQYAGAVTAEHGVGRLKVGWLPASRTETERKLMTRIKSCIDPRNLMNPGVILASQGPDKVGRQ